MTKREFEHKCSIMASTPQSRWFELRMRALETMLNNNRIPRLDISYVFAVAPMIGFVGNVFKIEDQYYFFLAAKEGNTIQCFNVETMDFSRLNNILASSIVLGSDDDADRITFLPLLMTFGGLKTRSELKARLDSLFKRAI